MPDQRWIEFSRPGGNASDNPQLRPRPADHQDERPGVPLLSFPAHDLVDTFLPVEELGVAPFRPRGLDGECQADVSEKDCEETGDDRGARAMPSHHEPLAAS